MLGFCITHILNTGCAKIWKKVRRQKVNILFAETLQTFARLHYILPSLQIAFTEHFISFSFFLSDYDILYTNALIPSKINVLVQH